MAFVLIVRIINNYEQENQGKSLVLSIFLDLFDFNAVYLNTY